MATTVNLTFLIANMYASSPNWSDEAAFEQMHLFLQFIDKLQKAKSVDPSVAEESKQTN